jgi:hypothetical protein
MSIGIDCLVSTQTEVIKGLSLQAERMCRTRSDNSLALQAFNQDAFLSDLASRILNWGNNCGDRTTRALDSNLKDTTSYIENILKVLLGQV